MNLNTAIKHLPGLALIGTIIVIISIAFLSLLPGSELPAQQLNDKVNHIIAYGVLAWLAVLGRHQMSLISVALLAVAYGGAIELLQGVMPYGRMASWLDMLANTIGVLIGALGALLAEISFKLRRS